MKSPFGKRPLLGILFTLAGLAILVFSIWIIHEANIGRDNAIFKTVRATPHGDKIGHVLLAGTLTLVANFFLRNRSFFSKTLPLPYGSLVILLILAIEELSQAYLPTRSLDIKDAAANFAGILLGSLPAILSARKKR